MKKSLPKSATNLGINLIGLFSFLLCLWYFREYPDLGVSLVHQTMWCMFFYALPILILELFFLKPYRRNSSGLDFERKKERDMARIGTRILGLYGTLAFINFIYWLFPEYHGDFYNRFWEFINTLGVAFGVSFPFYFYWIDKYQVEEKDGYWQVGRILLCKFNEIDRDVIINHLLGWIIKAFFFPLMFAYATNNVNELIKAKFEFLEFVQTYNEFWSLLFGIDVVVVSVGYLLTLKILDSHIRSPQKTIKGWLFALICYQPFWTTIGKQYLNYDDDNLKWDQWLSSWPTLRAAWGISILLLIVIYALASVSFGLRFSNLTHRGIITNGPYKFLKHPAYVSKNIAFWMISIPFISTVSSLEALRHCMLIALLNVVYYIRAKTEEEHLSEDPIYREYLIAMNEKTS
jgi:protein-S-isoprenylcysteine O-methyltransferase Ste14